MNYILPIGLCALSPLTFKDDLDVTGWFLAHNIPNVVSALKKS